MTIAGEDLLQANGGDLTPDLFPGKTGGQIEELLDGYVADGYKLADQAGLTEAAQRDTAAYHWGHVRGFGAWLQDAAVAQPASVAFAGQFSVSTTGDQFTAITRLRAEHLAAFRVLVPEDAGVDAGGPPGESRSTSLTFTW